MKHIFTVFFVFFYFVLSAQQKQFQRDERGRYIFYEVVDLKKSNPDTLMRRAAYFVETLHEKSLKITRSNDTSITSKGRMVIDKTILVANHPSGELKYNFVFELKGDKYRFWLTDFEYIPYQRNRYGNYVPSTHIWTELEHTPGKLTAGEWKDVVNSTYLKTAKFAEEFKKFLAADLLDKSDAKTEIITTKKW